MSWIRTITAALFLLVASVANAETPLTEKVIQQWLTSSDAIGQWVEKQDALDDDETDNSEDMLSVDVMINQLKAANLYDEAKSVMQKNGYDSPEQWASIQLRILSAMLALNMEDEKNKKMLTDIQTQLEQLKKNTSMSAEQKNMMINMMEEMLQASSQMTELADKASEADKSAIKPHLPQIKQIMKFDEED